MIYVEFVFYGNTFQIPYPKVRPIFHALILCVLCIVNMMDQGRRCVIIVESIYY